MKRMQRYGRRMSPRRKQRTIGLGRVYRRVSRHTGEELPTWWLAYCVAGKEVRESAHTTDHDAAVRLLRERMGEADAGNYVGPDKRRVTVCDLLAGLVEDYERSERGSLPTVRSIVKLWNEEMGDVRAVDVTTARLRQLTTDWKRGGKTPATINRRLASLRRAFRLGKVRVDPDRLDFSAVVLPENSPRGKYLPAEAFHAIHAELPDYLKDFVEFAYLTGIRRGQLARTGWANLNIETWVLRWQPGQVKNREPHELALAGRPLEIIKRRWAKRRPDVPYIFDRDGEPIGDFKRAWATACKAAGFPVGRKNGGYVFHNTRHTAVTNLVNAGVPAHEAMGVSGHRTRSVFDRYSIKLHEQTREALRRATVYVAALSRKRKVVPMRRRRSA